MNYDEAILIAKQKPGHVVRRTDDGSYTIAASEINIRTLDKKKEDGLLSEICDLKLKIIEYEKKYEKITAELNKQYDNNKVLENSIKSYEEKIKKVSNEEWARINLEEMKKEREATIRYLRSERLSFGELYKTRDKMKSNDIYTKNDIDILERIIDEKKNNTRSVKYESFLVEFSKTDGQ